MVGFDSLTMKPGDEVVVANLDKLFGLRIGKVKSIEANGEIDVQVFGFPVKRFSRDGVPVGEQWAYGMPCITQVTDEEMEQVRQDSTREGYYGWIKFQFDKNQVYKYCSTEQLKAIAEILMQTKCNPDNSAIADVNTH